MLALGFWRWQVHSIYLASSPKSNSAYLAIDKALSHIRNNGAGDIPVHLRNAPTKLMKELGYGDTYKYSHQHPNNFVDQEFMPKEISGTSFYKPGSSQREKDIAKTIVNLWNDKYPT